MDRCMDGWMDETYDEVFEGLDDQTKFKINQSIKVNGRLTYIIFIFISYHLYIPLSFRHLQTVKCR